MHLPNTFKSLTKHFFMKCYQRPVRVHLLTENIPTNLLSIQLINLKPIYFVTFSAPTALLSRE